MPGIELPDVVTTFGEAFKRWPKAVDQHGTNRATLEEYAREYSKLAPEEFMTAPCVVKRVRWIGGDVETRLCCRVSIAEAIAGGASRFSAEERARDWVAGVSLFRVKLPPADAHFDEEDRAASDLRFAQLSAAMDRASAEACDAGRDDE